MATSIAKIASACVPILTIAGLVVLLAMGKIDQAAGLGLIGAISGVHGGAVLTSSAASNAATQAAVQTQATAAASLPPTSVSASARKS